MRKLFIITLAVISILCACQKQSSQTKPLPIGAAALTTVPDPAVTGKDILFRLHLTDAAGKPVSGASVQAALEMPMMDMGKNEFTLTDKGNGDYEGKGQFTMTGPWNVIVNISAEGGREQRTFPLSVRE
ncbi:MAG: FixH family protein [Terriglobales bacterium]